MTHSSWVALHGMAHNFIELNKAVIHIKKIKNKKINALKEKWLHIIYVYNMENYCISKNKWNDHSGKISHHLQRGRVHVNLRLLYSSTDKLDCASYYIYKNLQKKEVW